MSLFNRTNIYTVHIDPSKAHGGEKAIFIREGFNIMAFLLGTIWALYHRLWREAFIILAVLVVLKMAETEAWLSVPVVVVLNLAFSVLIGFHANDLRRASLARRGYLLADVVVSDSELRAQQRYFDRVFAA